MPVAQRSTDVWLRWEEHGDPDGDPVLLIMGLGGSARPWWRLTPHIEIGRRVIAFDNRGTGESSAISGRISMRDLTDDALAVMDHAGLDSAHVIGVSMGGMISQHLALNHRDRVRSLLLGCTTAVGRSGMPPWRLLTATALRPAIGPQRTFSIVAPSLYAEHTLKHGRDRIAEDLRVRAKDATPVSTLVGQMGAIQGHDTRRRLGELEGLGVTVVHGEEDRLVPPERGRRIALAIPDAELVMMERCGHLLTTDDEAGTASAVTAHLVRHASASPSLSAASR